MHEENDEESNFPFRELVSTPEEITKSVVKMEFTLRNAICFSQN